ETVDAVAHGWIARVGENAPASQCARTELHASLKPGDDLAFVDPRGDVFAQIVKRLAFRALAVCPVRQDLLDFRLTELGSTKRYAHLGWLELRILLAVRK